MSNTIKINGKDRITTASTVIELLESEQIDSAARFVAVAINGSVLSRRSWPDAQIESGDDVEIVSPAPGG
jgi:thiamine biosynthesis protein ThiS